MLKKITHLILPILCCMLFSSCSQESLEDTTISAPEIVSESANATELSEVPTVLSAILGIQPEEMKDFSYYDTPMLSNAAFPVDGAGAITFSCGAEELYKDEQDVFTIRFAQALAEYRVGEDSFVSDEESPLPTGRYFSVWPSLQSDWNPVLTFFDSGEIYVYVNGGMDGINRYWYAEDPAQFHALFAVLEDIQAGLGALPLDYQLSMWLQHDYFKPESEALRLAFVNNGKDVVTAKSFLLEQETDNGWVNIGETQTPDLAIAPHREHTIYAIDLTAIPNAQEPGKYRVTGILEANLETLPLELEYTISEDATALSSPLLPEMTPENQEYCDRYISMWGQYSPFVVNFDEGNYMQDFHPYHLYNLMALAEGKRDEYNQEYGLHVPGEILEDMILRHFLFTAEQIRAWMPTKEMNESEYYDPETNIYHFEGGYGGGGYNAVVSGSHREGDLLTLICDWYDYADNFAFSQELTLHLGEGEHDFIYVSGRILKDVRQAIR